MNNLQVFKNEEFGEVRTVVIDNEPWFVGKDVATILGYSNPRDALAKRVDDEDKGVAKCDTLGGAQDLTVINESGLYSLILSSKLPTAKKFKRWVTSEVLPAIRKTGSYGKPKATRPLTTDDYIEAAKIVSKCTPMKLKIALDLLEKGGFDVPRIENAMEMLPQTRYAISDTVNGFFERMELEELIGTPTSEVYRDYTEYCEEKGKVPISNIVFSKHVNNAFGTHCHTKRIDGTVKRIFVIEEVGVKP